MISGSTLLLMALLSANPPPVTDDAATAALIGRLARPAPATTPYAEVRFAHLLRKPIVLHGELDYGGADHLGKRVDAPYRETTTISGSDVKVEREGHAPRQFALDRAPQLQALLASFSALLGGDAATLQKYYTVALVENAKKWTLTLTPKDSSLARQLRNIVVDGNEGEPRCFALTEANGDASILLIGALAKAQLPDPPTTAALATMCRAAP